MKRREVLKTLLAAPLAGVISGCAKRIHPHPLSFHALQVILHGPFALVLHTNDRNRITAYVPFDEQKYHELRFQNLSEAVSGRHPSYQFELTMKGLKAPQRPPYIDRCFADGTVKIADWRAEPENYFVSIDLPAPDLISFKPPADPVTFVDGTRGSMPSNHVLEYLVDDPDDVRLHSRQLVAPKPLSCTEFYGNYTDYRAVYEAQHKKMQPAEKMSPHMKEADLCSSNDVSTFFLGVGLPPNTPLPVRTAHALDFFNKRLLPSLHDDRVLREKQLLSIGEAANQNPGGSNPAPRLRGAVLRSSEQGPQPRLLMVSSIEDCQAPGIIALTSSRP